MSNSKPKAPRASSIKSQASEAAAAAEDEARELAEQAKDTAASHADAAKATLASEVDDTADQVRDAGRSFDEGSFADIAASHLADNLATAADAVRGTDLSSLQDDLSAFARRNPLVFFGGAAILGFAAARMMKASERAEHSLDDVPDTYAPQPSTPRSHPYMSNGHAGPRTYHREVS